MKIVKRFGAAIVGAALLAGCTSLSEGEFNTLQTALGSPAAKRQVIKECLADERVTPATQKNTYAAIMNVSPANYETAFCNRLFNALARGKITYSDYRKLLSPDADSSKVIKIMQGRY
jgi:outer membrane murein-binding lipoprotein Lpp